MGASCWRRVLPIDINTGKSEMEKIANNQDLFVLHCDKYCNVGVLVSTDTASAGCESRHADGRGREETSMIKILLI